MQADKRKQIAFYLFYSGLVLLVASLPLSKFTMSIAQFLIAGGWLMDGAPGEKFKKFFRSKPALIVTSLYLLHLIGLIYTSDFVYAWKDLRIKLPILLLPLLLSTAPKINAKQFEGILLALIGGVTISTLISLLIFIGVVDRPVNEIRDISIFISHIRLALLCCLSIVAIIWIVFTNRQAVSGKYYFLLLPVLLWLLYFLFLLESLTGIIILITTAIIVLNWLIFKYSGWLPRVLVVVMSIAVTTLIYFYVKSVNQGFVSRQVVESSQLEPYTPSGNIYKHFTDRDDYENGYPLWLYICESEMQEQWNKRSAIMYSGKDQRNQEIKYTLIRFLTSKGLRKDSAGVWSLTPDEIASIESGITNVDYQEKGNIGMRIHQVLWELYQYQKTGNPSGHSVSQRLEFWKAATGIIENNLIAGVGTGDAHKAFQKQYIVMETKLSHRWRLRAHNQYLSIAVSFGCIGLAWFLFTLIYPLIWQIRKNDVLYVSFSIISMMSMLTEDTLETQAGVTFFALFTSLFLFVNPHNKSAGVK